MKWRDYISVDPNVMSRTIVVPSAVPSLFHSSTPCAGSLAIKKRVPITLTRSGLAQVVDLKFFCGFSLTEISAMRGVSERTVQRSWEQARVYLLSQPLSLTRRVRTLALTPIEASASSS